MSSSKWRQLNTEVVYENAWIRVSHDEVVRPNGSEGIYGVVHFKTTAVGIVPLDDEDNTWLVKQSRYTLGHGTWEIPEGGSPLDEDTLDTAKRELQEEVGVFASDWQELMRLHTSNSVTDESAVVYVARGLSFGDQALEATEDIELKKLPLKDAIAMVENGEITDAISVAALLRLKA